MTAVHMEVGGLAVYTLFKGNGWRFSYKVFKFTLTYVLHVIVRGGVSCVSIGLLTFIFLFYRQDVGVG